MKISCSDISDSYIINYKKNLNSLNKKQKILPNVLFVFKSLKNNIKNIISLKYFLYFNRKRYIFN